MVEVLTTENATATLLERVPAFAEARAKDDSFISHEDDSPYLCFGDLDRYLLELLGRESNTPREAETTRQIFGLLNDMGNSSDPYVVNIVSTTAFEGLAGMPEGIVAARSHLTGQAAAEFERVVSWFFPHSQSNLRRAMPKLRTWLC
ncbi:MAG TPA: hypothetical protein VE135_26475 [Pyrinomonadaceae bacterium]|nr:hypothetical protein [Pyrinomonadaceae bacterium]